jgi:hypothetical protein
VLAIQNCCENLSRCHPLVSTPPPPNLVVPSVSAYLSESSTEFCFSCISMKAQSLISGFCSNPTTPSIPNTKKSFFHASIPPSSASFAQSRKWVSFKIQHSVPQRVCSNKQQRLKCKNGVEEVEGSENGVRRKKLAVFVSGGGSNFRSIHEASLGGSIHGDIVVLVTNKHGLFSIFTWLFLFILIVLCGLIVVSRSEFCLIMLCVVFN